MTFAEWVQEGETLATQFKDLRFAFADWVNTGLEAFSSKDIHAVTTRLGWTSETVRTYAWVARQIPAERRIYAVPFSHHIIVAAQPEPLRWDLLARAAAENLSIRELKILVRANGPKVDDDDRQYEVRFMCRTQADVTAIMGLVERMGYDVEVMTRAPSDKAMLV